MIGYRVAFSAFFVLIVIVGLGLHETNTVQSKTKDMREESVPLSFLLYKLGEANNCYFTIESAWTDDMPRSGMENDLLNIPEGKEELQSTLNYLQQTLPNLTFMINQSNNRIIHVIDARLLRQEDYSLKNVLKSVDFSGPLYKLPDYISKQGVPVRHITVGSLKGPFPDYDTVIKVKGQNLQLRTLLTNYIPLEGRGRILWIAHTKLGKGEISEVQFIKR